MFFQEIEIEDFEKKIVGLADEIRQSIDFISDSGRYKIRKEWLLTDKEIAEKIREAMGSLITIAVCELIQDNLITEYGSSKQKEAYEELQERAGVIVSRHFAELNGGPKSKTKDPAVEAVMVLEYLNDARKKINSRNKGFRTTDKANLKDIKARIKDGYFLQDFQKVIDHKCREWGNNADMRKYIRPSTLFIASHFSQYLTEAESSEAVSTPSGLDAEMQELMG